MKIYVYCSYKLSPVGFKLGTIDYNCDKDEDFCYLPKDENINCYVEKAFCEGIIKKISGKLPNSEKYIYMIKKIHYTNTNSSEDMGSNKKGNFAFEFDSYDEYKMFSDKPNIDKLAEIMDKFIVPDLNVEENSYALKIKHKELTEFINLLKNDKSKHQRKDDKDDFVVELRSKSDYIQKISNIFDLQFSKSDYEYIYNPNNKDMKNNLSEKKKKRTILIRVKAAAIILAILMLIVLLIKLILLMTYQS